jgi:hypothetical protein
VEATEAIRRLQNLGFDDHAGDLRVAAGAKRTLDASFIRVQRNAILECLEAINLAANGEAPSERTGPRPNDKVIADAQYWVSTIVSQGLHTLASLRASGRSDAMLQDMLVSAVTAVSDAWTQVLAGDIDGLSKDREWSST